MKKIILILLTLTVIFSFKQEILFNQANISEINREIQNITQQDIWKDDKIEKKVENIKVFTVIPHDKFVNKETGEYYQNLKEKYKDFDNIVLIWPNNSKFEWDVEFKNNGRYCYKNKQAECVNLKKIDLTKVDKNIYPYEIKGDYIQITDNFIWNHFEFVNKYFSNSNIYSVLLETNNKKVDYLKELEDKIQSYNFKWKTLFVSSVDFSSKVNEKVAVFHDLKTLNYLNWDYISDLEVDCSNCLYLIKDLAKVNNKQYFDLFSRISVDSILKFNSNYSNESFIYWEFTDSKVLSYEEKLPDLYKYSKFENTNTWLILHLENTNTWILNQNEVSWMFFWDAHFTRWFTYKSNKNSIENYLWCFYSNKDIDRKPQIWNNRLFYSFDIVWLNLETSVASEDECEKSNKSILFRTDPKYLDYFKEIWFNLFWIANNHSYDCWEIWFVSTKKYLWEKWLNYYWDGRATEENIFKTTINRTKIAVLWFNNVNLYFDENAKYEKIKKLKEEWYLVIINIHWWNEYNLKSNEKQQKLARWLIDNWSNLIIWHHPHVVQDYEVYRGVPIFYSLWNFIFDQPFEETLPWYWVMFSINNTWIKYNILEFERDPKSYMVKCDSFK